MLHSECTYHDHVMYTIKYNKNRIAVLITYFIYPVHFMSGDSVI